MQLRTKALDCLYLNWALPAGSAPELPAPLRYERHRWNQDDYVFVSALLFRLAGLHLRSLPFFRLSYSQMNLRLYVLDGDGIPSVLFRRMLVPHWIAPVSRLLGRQPATAARFDYPQPSKALGDGCWTWGIQRQCQLEVTGRMASPAIGPGPTLGSWEHTVNYFRNRPRGYLLWENRLRSVRTNHPAADVLPLQVEIERAELLAETLENVDSGLWQHPHSSWLCPEIPFLFELGKPRRVRLPARRVTAAEGC